MLVVAWSRSGHRRRCVFEAAGATGCRKSLVDRPVDWRTDVDASLAEARTQHRPVLLFFRASWGHGRHLDNGAFADPEVRELLARKFVSVRIDISDDDEPETVAVTRRFKIVGEPTILILGSDGTNELARITMVIAPDALAAKLRAASAPSPTP